MPSKYRGVHVDTDRAAALAKAHEYMEADKGLTLEQAIDKAMGE